MKKHDLILDEEKPEIHQVLAEKWAEQVDMIDAIPQKRSKRTEIVISPSLADGCERAMYYEQTNAPQDDTPVIPWQMRRATNATGAHASSQDRYSKLSKYLEERHFDIIAIEPNGSATKTVEIDGVEYTYKLRGRADILAKYVGSDPAIPPGTIIGIDLKFKATTPSQLKGYDYKGIPSYHRMQMTAYSLMTFSNDTHTVKGIDVWLIHLESLAKPKGDEPASTDFRVIGMTINEDERQSLIDKLEGLVKAIVTKELPKPDYDKCMFCRFKNQCAKDGDSKKGRKNR